MFPHVVPVGMSRTDRSTSEISTATAIPPGQPRITAQASTAAITQKDGIVEAVRASISSLCTNRVLSRAAADTSTSRTSSGRPRRVGAS